MGDPFFPRKNRAEYRHWSRPSRQATACALDKFKYIRMTVNIYQRMA